MFLFCQKMLIIDIMERHHNTLVCCFKSSYVIHNRKEYFPSMTFCSHMHLFVIWKSLVELVPVFPMRNVQ